MRLRPTAAGALTAAGLLVLTACGSTQPAADQATDTGGSDAGPITLTDATGATVELDAPAERVVVLEWQQVEDVLTLGVDPVGVADVKGYNTWNTAEELAPDTTDVGMRGEPNLDAVFSTNPDLIIMEKEYSEAVVKQLGKYDVPVLITQGADTEDPVGNMKDTFSLIAEALGKEDEAAAVLEEFDATVAEAEEQIAAAEPETKEFVYMDAWLDGSNVALRPFGQGSLVGELGEEIGLTNVWKGEVDPMYGLGSTDPEGLTKVGDAHFFYTSTESTDWVEALEGNRVYSNAAFVEADRVHPFPDGIWTFGGPRSSEQIIEAFVDGVA
jgi:iron complex transport system substrate-binding protein